MIKFSTVTVVLNRSSLEDACEWCALTSVIGAGFCRDENSDDSCANGYELVSSNGICPTNSPSPVPTPAPPTTQTTVSPVTSSSVAPTPLPTPMEGAPCFEYTVCGLCVAEASRCEWCNSGDAVGNGFCRDFSDGANCPALFSRLVVAAANCPTLAPTPIPLATGALPPTLPPTPTTPLTEESEPMSIDNIDEMSEPQSQPDTPKNSLDKSDDATNMMKNESGTEDNSLLPIIIGASIGVVCCCFAIVLIIVFRKRKREDRVNDDQANGFEMQSAVNSGRDSSSTAAYTIAGDFGGAPASSQYGSVLASSQGEQTDYTSIPGPDRSSSPYSSMDMHSGEPSHYSAFGSKTDDDVYEQSDIQID